MQTYENSIVTLTNKPPISSSTSIQLHTHRTVVQNERVVRSPQPAGHSVQDVILCITFIWILTEWKYFLLRKGNGFGDGALMRT